MQIISKIALITINETLLVQVISFLIFLFILNRLMFRPLNQVMGEREIHLEKINQEIVDTRQAFTDLTTRLEQKESAARQEALEISRQLEDAGVREAVEVVNAVKQEIDLLRKKNQQAVDAQIAQARTYVQREAEGLARTIMERVLDRRLAS